MDLHPLREQNLETLRDRVITYLREVRRPVDSPEIARNLLGGPGRSAGVSSVLIRALLERDARFEEHTRGRWSLHSPVEVATPLEDACFTVVDLEATGSNPAVDQILEVGMVRIEGLAIVDRFETLVRPSIPIPSWIRRLTGINEDAVRSAPSMGDIAPRVMDRMADATFVAHNVEFDYPFLRSHLLAEGYRPQSVPRLCTVRLARRHLPDLQSYRLDALAQSLNVPLDRHHCAVEDATATARIFLRMVTLLRRQGVDTVEALMATLGDD